MDRRRNNYPKSLKPLYRHIEQHGYFLCTIGEDTNNNIFKHGIGWQTTKYVRNKFDLDNPLNSWILDKEAVTACVIGVTQKAQDAFIDNLYELAKDLRNFEDDGTAGEGFSCARYEQALLGIIAYLKNLSIFRQDPQQQIPMNLSYDGTTHPFYMTWHPHLC